MKAPLTKAWFKTNMGPKIRDRGARKNLESHISGLESLEKGLLADPCNADKAKLMNNCINNVKSCTLKLKNVDAELKKDVVELLKGLKSYCNDHNSKVVEKISSGTIGSVPGGMKALEKQSKKEFTMESFDYMRATQKAKKEGTELMGIYKKYLEDINISSSERKKYTRAYKDTQGAYDALKGKETKTNPKLRKAALEIYDDAVNDLYTATGRCRASIVKMMNDSILRMKQNILLQF